jgi:hypothetical protein
MPVIPSSGKYRWQRTASLKIDAIKTSILVNQLSTLYPYLDFKSFSSMHEGCLDCNFRVCFYSARFTNTKLHETLEY